MSFYNELYAILKDQYNLSNKMKDNVKAFNTILNKNLGYENTEVILTDMDFTDAVIAYAENGEHITKNKMIKHLEKVLNKRNIKRLLLKKRRGRKT